MIVSDRAAVVLNGQLLEASILLPMLDVLKYNCDEVIVMSYETSGGEAIQRRAEDELKIIGDKVSIALSAQFHFLCREYLLQFDFEF